MKILFVTPWYPDEERPNSGIFIRGQAVALAKEHEVVVIALKVDYTHFGFSAFTSTQSFNNGVAEHRLVIARSLPFYNQFNYLRLALKFATDVGTRLKPDIIHTSIGYPGAVLGWRLSKALGVPFVFTEHTRPRNNFRSFWHKFATVAGMKRASEIMAVSSALANEIAPLVGRQPVIVPNIVDDKKYRGVRTVIATPWQIGFIGGMNTNVKGLDILLRAVAKIEQPFFLHICGDGTLMPVYKNLAVELGVDSRCKFYGFIDPVQIPGFFEGIHFLVCSSRYETFNVSLIEAMACGLPVVSTKCGGPEDFVSRESGILCEKENAAALAEAVTAMMQEYSRFSPQTLREVASRFRPEAIVKKLEAVYTSAIREFRQ